MASILLFGSEGMLGRYIFKYFENKENTIIFALSRKEYDVLLDPHKKLVNILKTFNTENLKKTRVVVNCIGLIPQAGPNLSVRKYIEINSVFPRILACLCETLNIRMIQPSTDCVFSGKRGNYTEADIRDATNMYGVSKFVGEPGNCTVIRTSIIGEEINSRNSLLSWAVSQSKIKGYTNHKWNGITCLEFAKIIDKIIQNGWWWQNVRHVFSPESVSKYNLLVLISDVFEVGLEIEPFETKSNVDKTLQSFYKTNQLFCIPSIRTQLQELHSFELR